jgi:hypothetical protein
MVRFLAARLILIAYSVTALAGQGLHAWIDDCDGCQEAVSVHDGHSHDGHAHGHHHHDADVAQATNKHSHEAGFHSPSHSHDCDHCAICQHQSLGQMFIAEPPAELVLAVCEQFSDHAPAAIACPALFSPAQPRAPPTVA